MMKQSLLFFCIYFVSKTALKEPITFSVCISLTIFFRMSHKLIHHGNVKKA